MNVVNKLVARYQSDFSYMNEQIMIHIESDEKLVVEIANYLINSGGKRIRPLLTILVANLCQNNASKSLNTNDLHHIYLAAAVEFIHAATLLHDDVVDNSNFRRFKEAAHKLWGNKASILVGDYLFSQAFELMVKSGSMRALKSLANATSVISKGEVSQLAALNRHEILSVEEYLEINRAKTAELFAAACEVGAIISAASDTIADSFFRFGMNFGQLYQIQDDWLDYMADSKEQLGKELGDDFREGKITLPIILLYEHVESVRIELKKMFLSEYERTDDDFKRITLYLNEYNIIFYIEKFIKDIILATENDILFNMNLNSDDQETLRQLMYYACGRSN